MRHCGISLLRTAVLLVVTLILAAILVPSDPGACGRERRCRHHLMQLYTLGTVYATQHKGNWPAPSSEGYWLSLTRTNPPCIDGDHLEILLCPRREPETPAGGCDYRGPRVAWHLLAWQDPIAADRPGNHGRDPIPVLLKDGVVVEVSPGDPLWKRCDEVLEP